MKPHVLLIAMAALLGLSIIDGGAAYAATYTSTPPGGPWSDEDTWTPAGGPPDGDDTAIIARGAPVTVDDALRAAWEVIVQDGATLDFYVAATDTTLTIGGTGRGLKVEPMGVIQVNQADTKTGLLILQNSNARHVIEGRLTLDKANSELRINTYSTVIAGGGRIVGENSTARIGVDAVELKCESTVEGALTIEGPGGSGTTGTFINDGLVHANRTSSPWIIACDDVIFKGSGEYRVGSNSSSEINFEPGVQATTMAANFTDGGGTLDMDDDVITTGHFSFVSGTLEVASGKVFEAN